MAIAVYLRQSQDREENQLAVHRQREDCEQLCAQRGWTETIEYCDNNVSANDPRKVRAAYRRMLADVEAGRVQGIVAYNLDRLYRQPRELEDLIDLADERGLLLATVSGDTDLSTDDGRLFARVKGAVARSEGERKSARIKRRNQQDAAAGRWRPTYRQFGYTRDAEPLEPEATLVRDAFRDVLDGKSLRRIAIEWNAAGYTTPDRAPKLSSDGEISEQKGVPWGNRQVRKLLTNPRYAGLRVWRQTIENDDGTKTENEVETPGSWEPLVDMVTWLGVKSLLNDDTRTFCTTFERKHQGSGVYRCGRCGSVMKIHYTRPGAPVAYMCKAKPHLVRRSATLDDFVRDVILTRLAQPDAALVIKRSDSVDVGALQAQRTALEARRKELTKLMGEGLLDAAEARQQLHSLKAKIAACDTKLADAARSSPTAALTASGKDLRTAWDHLDGAARGLIVDELLTVTVKPCPRGLRGFDPTYICVEWKSE